MVKLKHPYVMKGIPTISALRDFHIKVALYHQKCFSPPLAQKYFECVEQPPLWCSILKHLRFFDTSRSFRADPLSV